jgi:hypothetical protein
VAAEPIIDYTISDHAAYEIERRGIKIETIDQVLKNPDAWYCSHESKRRAESF